MSVHRRRHGPRVLDSAGQSFQERDRALTRAALRTPEGKLAFERAHGLSLGVTNGRITSMRLDTNAFCPDSPLDRR